MDSRVIFTDLRGRRFTYSVRRLEDFWADVPGNYIFAKRTCDAWIPLYIGETASLQKRLNPCHEAWDYCRRRGAAYVLARPNLEGYQARQDEARALFVAYDPPGNFPVPGAEAHLPNLSHAA
jgi:hypothetical protein